MDRNIRPFPSSELFPGESAWPSVGRRQFLGSLAALAGGAACLPALPARAQVGQRNEALEEVIDKGLNWVASTQSRLGQWTVSNYPTAMTALAGLALICSGSTTTQGPYSQQIRRAVTYLLEYKARPDSGLIGDPQTDHQYTYGHGFSMLFLSQVLGEEEDEDRREQLIEVLGKAVDFSCAAQTSAGGWGYVSAADGRNFDEGSTTITQVQGLRGCRNAGIPVPVEVITNAQEYIYLCKNDDGGISYSSQHLGASRPAITAAALATLYNAGDYESEHIEDMLEYCKDTLYRISDAAQAYGHWHYSYLYYAQVMYRQGGDEWEPFRDKLYERIMDEQASDGSWNGNIGPIYVTAINLIILQLDYGYLPIFQR